MTKNTIFVSLTLAKIDHIISDRDSKSI